MYFSFVTAEGSSREKGRRLETGSPDHRTKLLITIRKALGSHGKRWSRESSKLDQKWRKIQKG